jgi:uncharacterized protein YyaL (SSP411 family)
VALITTGDDDQGTKETAGGAAGSIAAGTALGPFLTVLCETFRPHLVIAARRAGTPSAVPLLQHREPLDGETTAYLCRTFACRQPVTDPAALAEQLA